MSLRHHWLPPQCVHMKLEWKVTQSSQNLNYILRQGMWALQWWLNLLLHNAWPLASLSRCLCDSERPDQATWDSLFAIIMFTTSTPSPSAPNLAQVLWIRMWALQGHDSLSLP